jgi:hypothetical protein
MQIDRQGQGYCRGLLQWYQENEISLIEKENTIIEKKANP